MCVPVWAILPITAYLLSPLILSPTSQTATPPKPELLSLDRRLSGRVDGAVRSWCWRLAESQLSCRIS